MTSPSGKKTLSDYVFALIAGFIAQAEGLSSIEHRLTKGELRELFVQSLLKHFLPENLGVGTGVVINNQTDQSHQMDIVIYDKRALPPFLMTKNRNVFPIESVVSTIEVKSRLDLSALKQAEKSALHLIQNVIGHNNWLQPEASHNLLCAVFGLSGTEVRVLSTDNNQWISQNIKALSLICSVGKFSWGRMESKGKIVWRRGSADETYKEIRRFLAILVDNTRTFSKKNWTDNLVHRDWLGQYIRDE